MWSDLGEWKWILEAKKKCSSQINLVVLTFIYTMSENSRCFVLQIPSYVKIFLFHTEIGIWKKLMCVFFHSFQTWKWSQKSIFLVKLKTRLLHTFESSLKISIFYSSHFPSCLRNKESTAFNYKLWAKCLTWLNLPPSPLNFSVDSVTKIRFLGKGNHPKNTLKARLFLIFA